MMVLQLLVMLFCLCGLQHAAKVITLTEANESEYEELLAASELVITLMHANNSDASQKALQTFTEAAAQFKHSDVNVVFAALDFSEHAAYNEDEEDFEIRETIESWTVNNFVDYFRMKADSAIRYYVDKEQLKLQITFKKHHVIGAFTTLGEGAAFNNFMKAANLLNENCTFHLGFARNNQSSIKFSRQWSNVRELYPNDLANFGKLKVWLKKRCDFELTVDSAQDAEDEEDLDAVEEDEGEEEEETPGEEKPEDTKKSADANSNAHRALRVGSSRQSSDVRIAENRQPDDTTNGERLEGDISIKDGKFSGRIQKGSVSASLNFDMEHMANFLTSKLSGISELFTSSKKVGHPRRRPMKEDLGDHVIIGPAVDGNGDVPTTTPTAPTETKTVDTTPSSNEDQTTVAPSDKNGPGLPDKWYKKNITFTIKSFASNDTETETRNAIYSAFKLFSDVSPLRFDEVSSGGDITLEFSTVDAYADPLGNIYSRKHCESNQDEIQSCHIYFNTKYSWTVFNKASGDLKSSLKTNKDILSFAIRSIARALGLHYSSDKASVMCAKFVPIDDNGKYVVPRLDAHAIAQLQALYGKKDA